MLATSRSIAGHGGAVLGFIVEGVLVNPLYIRGHVDFFTIVC